MLELMKGWEVVMREAEYSGEGYEGRIGWGHSPLSSAVELALDANVKRVLLFHHDPSHDDDMIDRMVERARELVRKSGKTMVIEGAREGAEMLLERKDLKKFATANPSCGG